MALGLARLAREIKGEAHGPARIRRAPLRCDREEPQPLRVAGHAARTPVDRIAGGSHGRERVAASHRPEQPRHALWRRQRAAKRELRISGPGRSGHLGMGKASRGPRVAVAALAHDVLGIGEARRELRLPRKATIYAVLGAVVVVVVVRITLKVERR